MNLDFLKVGVKEVVNIVVKAHPFRRDVSSNLSQLLVVKLLLNIFINAF
jgi:hypothetical protein